MHQSALLQLTVIIVLGVAAQLAAAVVRIPSILVLLIAGVIVGPVLGLVGPDELFGDLLEPIVSISVALILYEGGLSLRVRELPGVGRVVASLVTIGTAVTWVAGALGARYLLGVSTPVALLLGAILTVTGPTVVGPLVRHIRPRAPVGPVLMWEGIVIDPIGALLAVLVFEAIAAGELSSAAGRAAIGVVATVFGAGALGLAGAGAMIALLRRYWLPDVLINPASLMLVVAVSAAANLIQPEAGLFAATVMGVALANQRIVNVGEIVEFKESLRVLLISCLFVILAARVELRALREAGAAAIAFVGVLIFIARPVAVWLSTIRSPLTWKQRAFLAWMAPRGIVAAAVSSVFALRLENAGAELAGVGLLAPTTFIVIVVTVVVYGLSAPAAARALGVADPNPQGLLIVGAHPFAQQLAAALAGKGVRVLLVDTNRQHAAAARMDGLEAVTGDILAEHVLERIDMSGLGRMLALTPNDEVNALAAHRCRSLFGRGGVYQLSPRKANGRDTVPDDLRGRALFSGKATFAELSRRVAGGARIKATPISEEFTFESYRRRYGAGALPLFILRAGGALSVLAADAEADAESGDMVIGLVNPETDGANAGT